MKRIAFYGGSFDPIHNGHLAVARTLIPLFGLEAFFFLPAFHAPHKPLCKPASAFHRVAMLAIATARDKDIFVSQLEVASGEKRFTIETLPVIRAEYPESSIFFVMGADSWTEIRTWKRWEEVLSDVNHIVVSRPGYSIEFEHIGTDLRRRIVDLRSLDPAKATTRIAEINTDTENSIFVTDSVDLPISATAIREDARDGAIDALDDLPDEVANYIEKYELYR
ncbi:MAG: nicotinate-nucleotide adenylyltransferase [Pyrinomonadaceae bacterium]